MEMPSIRASPRADYAPESADFNSEALRRAGSGHGSVTECPLLPATSNSIV
jgi:hypothetical protein